MYGLVVLAILGLAIVGDAQETRLVPFEMPDQFDNLHSEREFTGTVVVFLGSGRKGSKFNEPWGKVLAGELAGAVRDGDLQIVGFAHLRGVPSFLSGSVRKRFPQEPEEWALLDWKGFFARTYGRTKGAANLYAFDRSGRLIHRSGLREVDRKQLADVVAALRKALATGDEIES